MAVIAGQTERQPFLIDATLLRWLLFSAIVFVASSTYTNLRACTFIQRFCFPASSARWLSSFWCTASQHFEVGNLLGLGLLDRESSIDQNSAS